MAVAITRIATLQRNLRELGRIRLGDQAEYVRGDGSKGIRPRKLATFRLTSASRDYIAAAAEAYGGTVTEWPSPRGTEYQVTIESPTLDVLVPPGNSVTQAYELWTAGGCERRCDGELQESLGGDGKRLPCACPADVDVKTELAAKGQACKPTTRLWVILPRLPDLGRWRLEAHGYYAAIELAGMAEIASMATSRGIMLNARLRIDQRTRKIPGKAKREYIVPVLELPDTNFGQLVAAGFIPTTAAQLADGGQPALPSGESQQKALAPGKRERAERPAMGNAPSLPEEAQFTRAVSADFGEAPAPTTVGGWTVEPADPGPVADAPPAGAPAARRTPRTRPAPRAAASGAAETPAPAAAATRDVAPESEGLSAEEFAERLRTGRVAREFAMGQARSLFPDWDGATQLTAAQRLQLWRVLAPADAT